jgi:hypothetical protein
MATATQPIGQSLFDFLDSSKPWETLEAIRNGELGRQIDQFVHEQLDRFQIGSINHFEDPLTQETRPWINQLERSTERIESEAIMFRSSSMLASGFDLVGQEMEGQRIQASKGMGTDLGGIDDGLSNRIQGTDQIFRTHRR